MEKEKPRFYVRKVAQRDEESGPQVESHVEFPVGDGPDGFERAAEAAAEEAARQIAEENARSERGSSASKGSPSKFRAGWTGIFGKKKKDNPDDN
ncbi:MAG: hypothetical protein ABH851_06645 [Methanobacteriota archaeon]